MICDVLTELAADESETLASVVEVMVVEESIVLVLIFFCAVTISRNVTIKYIVINSYL